MMDWQTIAIIYGCGVLVWMVLLGMAGSRADRDAFISAFLWPIMLPYSLGAVIRDIFR